ncbi:hypothetical protein CEE37_12955 [candidate division LCP-89 bacterium B3_LCP]|uniref:AdoMet activation domain-containing protein n=1 Tax=candidate division LCP-89 bacterium B3_LCP TaxID=2012998 RepID=A0A532UU32_UNCL8|nr:MAG: hypothetical protein CEE37_12955 [candidate division LCP-89 bacterium B3_LCP]
MEIITDLKSEPDLKHVHSRMGFKGKTDGIPENMQKLVDEMILCGQEICTPKAVYDYKPAELIPPNIIELEGSFSINSSKAFNWMEGCSGLYLAAVTIGPGLDREVARLSESDDMTRAFLLNAYGAEAAEATMAELNKRIIGFAREQGLSTTKRYSPGYGDWHISAQSELLGSLQVEQIGIQLTDSYLMIPEKSVSAIIGAKPIA